MKKLSDHLPSTTNWQASESAPESTRAIKVWTAMAEMFGNTFLSQYGASPPSVWTAQIELLSDDEIRNGLSNLVGAGLAFPPNLSQLFAECKKVKPAKFWSGKKLPHIEVGGKMSRLEWMSKNKTGDTP